MLLFLNFLIFLVQVLLFCNTINSAFCLNTLFLLSVFLNSISNNTIDSNKLFQLMINHKKDWIDLTFKTIFLFRNRLQLVARPTLRQMPVQPAPMRRRRRKGMSVQSRRRRTPSQRRRLDVIQVFQRHFLFQYKS